MSNRTDGPALNEALAGTGALLGVFSLLVSAGLLLAELGLYPSAAEGTNGFEANSRVRRDGGHPGPRSRCRRRGGDEPHQKAGPGGCVTQNGLAGQCADGAGLVGPTALVLSPDGKNVYAADGTWDSVAALAREPGDGALTPIPGLTGCLSITPTVSSGCTRPPLKGRATSRSAPTARTSTSPRPKATRSRSSTATRATVT